MNNYEILVNKNNRLPMNYVPENLINLPRTHEFMSNQQLVLAVGKEFMELQYFSHKNGLDIYVCSGYRSYLEQLKIYGYNVYKKGPAVTRRRVALPGTSEHQTGLAFDVGIIENNADKNITRDESIWLTKNASEFGFILRYPEGKEKITGFDYEPWHFRYVGSDLADYITKKGLTLEEYYENSKYTRRLKK